MSWIIEIKIYVVLKSANDHTEIDYKSTQIVIESIRIFLPLYKINRNQSLPSEKKNRQKKNEKKERLKHGILLPLA